MEIIDYSRKYNIQKDLGGRHAEIFPRSIFCIIAGSTGSGKTNLMVNLLLKEGILNYSDVSVYSTTLYQPAYQYLRSCYEIFEKMIRNETGRVVKIVNFYDSHSVLVDPATLAKESSHIMVFDDAMLEDQTQIKRYFCSGRHNNINVFYLVQSLHKIAKHCIRDNANIFILFKQDDKTLKYFYDSHVSGDMSFKEFKEFCDGAWAKGPGPNQHSHGFVVINVWDEPESGRYWDNYTKIFIPTKTNKHIDIIK